MSAKLDGLLAAAVQKWVTEDPDRSVEVVVTPEDQGALQALTQQIEAVGGESTSITADAVALSSFTPISATVASSQ